MVPIFRRRYFSERRHIGAVELLHSGLERAWLHSQHRRRKHRSASHDSSASSIDTAPLSIVHCQHMGVERAGGIPQVVLGIKGARFGGEDDGPLDDIAQLTDIPRPGVIHQVSITSRNRFDVFAHSGGEF
jgi:hypothetical protein